MTRIGQRPLLQPDPLRRLLVRGFAGAAVSTIPLWPNAAQADRQGAASLAVSIPLNPVLLPMEGKTLLLYELHLLNHAPSSSTIQSIVIDARCKGKCARRLADYGNAELAKRMAHVGATGAGDGDALRIPPAGRAIVYLELEIGQADEPVLISHDIHFVSGHVAGVSTSGTLPGKPADPLGPPLAGGPWVAVHSAAWPRGHRRMIYAADGVPRIPGRYAVDFVRVDVRGRTGMAGSDRVADVLGYGAPVLAVADGVVASTRDDMDEVATLSAARRHSLADATGNYLSLRLADGRVVFYEHLKPGSINVASGDRVKAGEAIAALGFTGDSSGPHLHFSLASSDSPLGAEGLPFVFEHFELLGHYANIQDMGKAPWRPLDGATGRRRKNEWPGWNAVVRFS